MELHSAFTLAHHEGFVQGCLGLRETLDEAPVLKHSLRLEWETLLGTLPKLTWARDTGHDSTEGFFTNKVSKLLLKYHGTNFDRCNSLSRSTGTVILSPTL